MLAVTRLMVMESIESTGLTGSTIHFKMVIQMTVKLAQELPSLALADSARQPNCCRQTSEIDFETKAIWEKVQSRAVVSAVSVVVAVAVVLLTPFPMDVCNYLTVPIDHCCAVLQLIAHSNPNWFQAHSLETS